MFKVFLYVELFFYLFYWIDENSWNFWWENVGKSLVEKVKDERGILKKWFLMVEVFIFVSKVIKSFIDIEIKWCLSNIVMNLFWENKIMSLLIMFGLFYFYINFCMLINDEGEGLEKECWF